LRSLGAKQDIPAVGAAIFVERLKRRDTLTGGSAI
jgi:hypothetical protein